MVRAGLQMHQAAGGSGSRRRCPISARVARLRLALASRRCSRERALMGRPRLICMDELTMSLSPLSVDRVLELIWRINGQGLTLFMVEQNATLALQIALYGSVLQAGHSALASGARSATYSADPRCLSRRRVRRSY